MGKKILAYLFRLLGILCVLSVIGNIMGLLTGKLTGTTNIEKVEYLGALFLAGLLAYVFFKYSNKWLRKKQNNEIDNIGKEGS